MIKFSVNYSYTNNNFVICNLEKKQLKKYLTSSVLISSIKKMEVYKAVRKN